MAHTIRTPLCSPAPRRSAFSSQLKALFIFIGVLLNVGLATEEKKSFDVPAGEALATLKQAAQQAGAEIVFTAETVRGVKTNAVKGSMSAREALAAMVANTDLHIVQDQKTGALAVTKNGKNDPRAAQTDSDRPASRVKVEDGTVKMDTFEVMGSKLLNMDLKRSRDDAQPYVIFSRAVIDQSGATNIEDFLRQRLTMETTATPESQTSSLLGARSTINLRGLGSNQTLILIDGHRTSGGSVAGTPFQADLNGIPLGAVERIEILPTTASGIYGGSATGGVVNVILRRDYAGAEMKVTYDNTFDTDAAKRRVDLSAGFTLEGGKTNIILAASYTDANTLLVQDRDFLRKGRAAIMANNPNYFLTATGISPPLGYTTNIRSSTTANLTLKNGTPLNSTYTHIPVGYAGTTTDSGAALVANAGRFNLDGANSANFLSGGLKRALLNGPVVESLSATIRRQFNPRFQAFVDLSASNNTGHFIASAQGGAYTIPATATNNPFAQSIRVTVPLLGTESEYLAISKNRRAVAGLIAKLPAEWQAGLDLTLDRSWFSNGFPFTSGAETAAIASGALDVMRDVNRYPVDLTPFVSRLPAQDPITTEEKIGTLRSGGPVWALPAGNVTVNAFVERREMVMSESFYRLTSNFIPERSQKVNSAYVEAKIPLVSARNRIPLVQELELQLAGRHDDYTTNGTNTSTTTAGIVRATNKLTSSDPTVGLRYVPVKDVMLRASYGTGFLPPTVAQLVQLNAVPFSNPGGFTTDPRRGNTLIGPFTFVLGGHPELKPELSESWSAGLVLTPHRLSGLRLSVDWSRIEKRDNIITPGFIDIIVNELALPGRVTRGPVPAGDPYSVGPITFLDLRSVNLASAEIEAFDLSLDYEHKTESRGTFSFFAAATRTVQFKTQFSPTSPIIENVGTVSGAGAFQGGVGNYPLKFKANFGVNWNYRRWTVGWAARYYDSYLVTSTQPGAVLAQGNGGRVPSQTYHDVFASYRFGTAPAAASDSKLRSLAAKLSRRTEVQIGVRNLFNTEPPFEVTNQGNLYSGFVDPRISSYYISVKKTF